LIRDSKIKECAGYRITGFILEKPNPHARAHSTATEVDTAVVDGAVGEDECSDVTIVAGRTEPPPASPPAFYLIAITCICSLLDCVVGRRALSCVVTFEVLVCLHNAQEEHIILRRIAGIRAVFRILVRTDITLKNVLLFLRAECPIIEGIIQPTAKCTLLPRGIYKFRIIRLAVQRVSADQQRCFSVTFQHQPFNGRIVITIVRLRIVTKDDIVSDREL